MMRCEIIFLHMLEATVEQRSRFECGVYECDLKTSKMRTPQHTTLASVE